MRRRELMAVLAAGGLSGCLRLSDTEETSTGTSAGQGTRTPRRSPAVGSPSPGEPTGDTEVVETDSATATETASQPAADVAGEWPQPGYDVTKTGYAPDTQPLKRDPSIAWTVEVPSEIPALGPVVAEGSAYVPDADGTLMSLDLETGERQWDILIDEEANIWAASVHGDRVIAVSKLSTVTAIGLDGRRIWEFSVGDPPVNGHHYMLSAGATPANGSVYVGSGTGQVFALSTKDGSVQWQTDVGVYAGGSTPAVGNNGIYIGDLEGNLYCISFDGEVQWSVQPPKANAIVSAPVISDGRVYVGTITADDGEPIEQPNIGYLSDRSLSGGLHSIDVSSGEVLWTVDIAEAVYTSPAVTEDLIVVGSWGENVFAYSKQGNREWFYPGGFLDGSPAIANDVLYLGSGSAVHAVSLSTGRRHWKVNTETKATSPALVDQGVLVGDFMDSANNRGGNCYFITQA